MAALWINRLFLPVIVCFFAIPMGHAQVVTDGSLGQATALAGPDFQVTETLGKSVGGNLFHSFSEFNLQDGESVVFTGPENIQNILGRVTGGKTSRIDGLVQSKIKGANLYLLNPKGFLFGKNAEVDVGGAFSIHATEKLKLEEGGVFDAVDPDRSVFVSAPPEAFGFLDGNPGGEIKLDSAKLTIEGENRSLRMVGGKIDVTGRSSITLNKGASFSQQAKSIHHNQTIINSKIKKGDTMGAGDIEMVADEIRLVKPKITMETREGDPGDLVVKSNDTHLQSGEIIVRSRAAGKVPGVRFIKNKPDEKSTFEVSRGGSITSEVKSTGAGSEIKIEHDDMNWEEIKITSLASGDGAGSGVSIKGNRLFTRGDIISSVSSKNVGGDIEIEVDDVTVKNGKIHSVNTTSRHSTSKGGDITIKANSFTVLSEINNAGATFSETIGDGKAGDVVIEAQIIDIQGKNISTPIWFWAHGNIASDFGGVGSVTHKRGGKTLGGNTGDVTLKADQIKLSRSGVVFVVTKGSGDAGTLNLEAQKLEIIGSEQFYTRGENGWNSEKDYDNEQYDSQITGQVWDSRGLGQWELSSGKGGDLNITVDELIMTRKGRIRLESWGSGPAGTLKLKAEKIRMSKNSTIDAYAEMSGNGGAVFIYSNDIELDESRIEAFTKGTGMPGEISIKPLSEESPSVFKLINGSELSTSLKSGSGVGGDLNVKTDELVIIRSKIKSDAGIGARGAAGSININTDSLRVSSDAIQANAEITATTRGKAQGGRININSDFIDFNRMKIMSESTSKRSTVSGGDSGTIQLNSKDINLGEGVLISTSTHGRGDAGLISIQADSIQLNGGETVYDAITVTSNTRFRDQDGVAGDVVGGDGGSLRLQADRIHLGKNVFLSSETFGNGKAGELTIESKNLEITDGTQVSVRSGFVMDSKYSDLNKHVTGQGGDLRIQAENIKLTNGAMLSATSMGMGEGGSIELVAPVIEVTSDASVESRAYSKGDAGSIQVEASELKLHDGVVVSDSKGEGAAGSINLTLDEGLTLGQAAKISVSSIFADGGHITINTDGKVQLANSELTAAAARDGGSIRLLGAGRVFLAESLVSAEAGRNGGNIEVRSPETLVLQRSTLSANAIHGNGGFIAIAADGYLPSLESIVSASSEFGLEGSVEIDTPETNVGSGLAILPDGLLGTDANITDRCALRLHGDVSSFFLNGNGGLPTAASENYLPAIFYDEPEE